MSEKNEEPGSNYRVSNFKYSPPLRGVIDGNPAASGRESQVDDSAMQYVVFTLDSQRYALHLASVERTVRAVEIIPLPKAPEIVLGVINVQGQIIPVLNIRKRFGLPERELELSDQIIIARMARRTIAFAADSVSGIVECSGHEVIPSEKVIPGLVYVEGVIKLKEGLLLINDIDKFFLPDEEKELDKAIEDRQ